MILTLFSTLIITILLFLELFKKGKIQYKLYFISYIIAGTILLLEIIIRSVRIKFPALTTGYDVIIFFILLVYFILSYLSYKNITPGKLYILVNVLLIFSSLAAIATYKTIELPQEILQSKLLIVHVLFSFLGEAILFISFTASLLNLNENFIYKTTLIGYIFYTTGALLLGSIWAYFAWGSFWNWDAKELWALITCLIYTIILHSKKHMRLLNIIGFTASIITFVGVNYFIPSMHSYIGV